MDLRWNDGTDPELEQLLGGDLELLDLSRRLRAARPEPRVDPEFQRRLRVQLMAAAETQLRPRGLGRLLRPRSSLFAYGAAGLGGAMIAAAALAYYAPHSDHVTVVQGVALINEDHLVDPGNAIKISFNREMDRGSVERGLKIQPAIAYYPPTWQGNELVIKPKHSLQPNSPYVVTIPRSAARDVKGDVASRDVVITFGTRPVAPAPTGTPLGPLALVAHEAGPVAEGSLLGFGGDGSLLATAGLVAAGGSPAAPAPALVRYGGDGPVRIGDAATAVALSPAGHSLATLTPSGDGHGVVAVSDIDGTHRSVLSSVADARSPLGWSGDATPAVLFVSGGQLTSVDLEHHQHTIAGVNLDPSQPMRLAPWGRYLFVGPPAATTGTPPQGLPSTPLGPLLPGIQVPGGVLAPAPPAATGADAVPFATSPSGPSGHVVDLKATTGTPPLQLPGLNAGELPGFSADGRRVTWVDRSGATPVISVQPLDGSGPATRVVPVLAGGDSVGALSLDGSGERVAYAVLHGDGSGELRVVRVSDSGLLATAPAVQPSGLTFSPYGAALAYLQRSGSQITAQVVSLAGVPGAPTAGTAVAAAAGTAIDQLVKAEVDGHRSALDPLVATTLEDELLGQLPGGLSRGYVISAAPVPGSDSVTAQIRLLRDPTNGHPTAAFADQEVTLRPAGAVWLVSQSRITRPFHDEPSGPQVVHVETSRLSGLTTVRLTFDSDLDPSSVTESVITLVGAASDGALKGVKYDLGSRTVTVTFLRLREPLEMKVGIGVRDVNGQGLAAPFVTTVSPAQ
jgi:hypothetical protein